MLFTMLAFCFSRSAILSFCASSSGSQFVVLVDVSLLSALSTSLATFLCFTGVELSLSGLESLSADSFCNYIAIYNIN